MATDQVKYLIIGLLCLFSLRAQAQPAVDDGLEEQITAFDFYSQIFEEFTYVLDMTDSFMFSYQTVDDNPKAILAEQEFWSDQIRLSITTIEDMPYLEEYSFLQDGILQVMYKLDKLSQAYRKQIVIIIKSKKRDVNWDKLMYEMSNANASLDRYMVELDPLINKAGKLKKGFRKKYKLSIN